jgi:meso-butanediol dehydrogenase / (S,S)-butanediol dehydrogenase / diacetyl reductase
MGSLDGKTAIVTGAGRGIGRAISEEYAKEGARVAVASRTESTVNEVVGKIRADGGDALGIVCDVGDRDQIRAMVDRTVEVFGGVDILVNNAGIAVAGDRAAEVSEDVWDRILDVNAKGVWLGMRAVLPEMVARKRGKICNVASTAAHIGLKDAAAYCASKGAVLALTRQAGVQYAPNNVQINSVSPGTTMTGLQRDVTEAQRAAFLPLTPIGRFAASPEVSAVVLFLCSDGSSFMAGADVSVDGGMVAQ